VEGGKSNSETGEGGVRGAYRITVGFEQKGPEKGETGAEKTRNTSPDPSEGGPNPKVIPG